MYKVVRKVAEDWGGPYRYYSAITYNFRFKTFAHKYLLEYKLGEWTWPNVGKIMVFDTEYNAIQFIGCESKYEIFPCEVLNPKKSIRTSILHVDYFDLDNDDAILSFWDGFSSQSKCHEYYTRSIPEGTYFCDAIRLMPE